MKKTTIYRRLKIIVSYFYKIGLKNKDFSIISNNCWGGLVYDRYRIKYLSPTIGLWIPPKDFIKFICNLEFYIKNDIQKISYLDSHVKNLLIERKKAGKYKCELEDIIIGRIIDIDIIFLHYDSFDSARNKWNRRKQRINYKNIIYKFNDQNCLEEEDFFKFQDLCLDNKIFFTSNKKFIGYKNVVYFNKLSKSGSIIDDTNLKEMPFDIKKYLNDCVRS